MKKKIFFISDLHGNYTDTIKCLKNKGYNENNENHLIVVLGDIFDRGQENLEVYEWLYKATKDKKAIVTNGNHHKFFIDFLEGSINPFNYIHNGMDTTIGDFWHRTRPFESWCLLEDKCDIDNYNYARWAKKCRNDIKREYPELLGWLKSLPEYFESENYIGVHASLDLKVPDWHYPHCFRHTLVDWEALHFDDGNFFTQQNTTGKNLVLGHFSTSELRRIYGVGDADDHSILKTEDNKYFIDTCTILTNKVNVLVVEDYLLD